MGLLVGLKPHFHAQARAIYGRLVRDMLGTLLDKAERLVNEYARVKNIIRRYVFALISVERRGINLRDILKTRVRGVLKRCQPLHPSLESFFIVDHRMAGERVESQLWMGFKDTGLSVWGHERVKFSNFR